MSPAAARSPSLTPSALHEASRGWPRAAVRRFFSDDPDFLNFRHGWAGELPTHPVDYVFLDARTPFDPPTVFAHLRWGGQVIFAERHAVQTARVHEMYREHSGFTIDHEPTTLHLPRRGLLRCSPWRRRMSAFVARRTALLPPGQVTDRFVFDVTLAPGKGVGRSYVVRKRVPSLAQVLGRLRQRAPRADPGVLKQRAAKVGVVGVS